MASLQLQNENDTTDLAAEEVVALPSTHSGSVIVTAFLSDSKVAGSDVDRYRRICGCWWSGNMRVLLVTAVLFMIITLAQLLAAHLASSEALFADCVSMGIDALTYFMNIGVEAVKGRQIHRIMQLIAPALSIGLLTLLTILVMQSSISTLQNEDQDGGEDEVNPWIVLAFALLGLVFDIASMLVFRRNAKRSGSRLGVNMLAAFLHVGADFVRSFVTLIESILIIGFGFNGTSTDAWACVFVSVSILCGAVYAIYEWIIDAFGCRKAENGHS